MKFNVITFGSATYDIYLTSNDFELRKSSEGMMLCELYGKKVEIEECVVTTGGGATNTAVCFERLGLQSAVIACVGRDHWGAIVRSKLAEEGVSLVHFQTTKKKTTSSSTILVGNDGGRTILVYRAASNLLSWHQVDWDRLDAEWLYVSSLGGDFTLLSRIIRLSKEKAIKVAFNPGSQELDERDKLKKLLPAVDVLIVNKQEALTLLSKRVVNKEDLITLGSNLVVLTDGRNGTTVYTANGVTFHQPIIKAKTREETGAGDAFGSSFIAGLLYDLPIEKALRLAACNAAQVVEHIGPKEGLLFLPEAKNRKLL